MPAMEKFRVLSLINPISYPRIGGIIRFADANGWSLTIHDRLFGRQPTTSYDGVLVTLRENMDVVKYVRALRRRHIPVVDLTVERPEIHIPRVISDHNEIGRVAGRHFAERGFTNVAWFSTRWSNVHRLRYVGLSEVCANPPTAFVPQKHVSSDGREIARWVAALRKPVALLAYDETDAQFLVNVCLDAQMTVPDEVAVLAIGNDPLVTRYQPMPISYIGLNPERNGYAAAALLDRLMRGGEAPEKPIMIKPDGISVRKSTDTYAHENRMIRKVLLYIRDNMSHPFGAEQIAEALGESRSRLDKTCAADFGHSLGKEILQRRLVEAKRLLKTTDLQIAEIASSCGFCSSAYFVERFRAVTGLTPRHWRVMQGGHAHAHSASMPASNRQRA